MFFMAEPFSRGIGKYKTLTPSPSPSVRGERFSPHTYQAKEKGG